MKLCLVGLCLLAMTLPGVGQERIFARVQTVPNGLRVYQMDSLTQPIYLGTSDKSRLELYPSYSSSVHLAFVYVSPLPFRDWLNPLVGPASPVASFEAGSDCVVQGWTVKDSLSQSLGPYRLPLGWLDRSVEHLRVHGWIWALGLGAVLGRMLVRPQRIRLNLKCSPNDVQISSQDGETWLGSASVGIWLDRRKIKQNLVIRLHAPGYDTHYETVPLSAIRLIPRNGTLDWPAQGQLRLRPKADEQAPWELRPGAFVQDYRIEERLGEGVSAVVYRVSTPTRDENHSLALKLLKPSDYRGTDVVARFQREMKALARLRHPNIPFLSDYGEEQGMMFLTMELLHGRPLGSLVSNLSREQAWEYLRQVTHALAYAHQCGVLHRDVKPDNVVVGEDGNLHLTDFGLSRSHDSSTLTAEGTLLGTPAYIAPEVVTGQPATAASDRYSLACMAFEMFTGRPPFQGDSPLSIAVQHVHQEPPDLGLLAEGLPPSLVAVIHKTLAKAPEERIENLQVLLDILEEKP